MHYMNHITLNQNTDADDDDDDDDDDDNVDGDNDDDDDDNDVADEKWRLQMMNIWEKSWES